MMSDNLNIIWLLCQSSQQELTKQKEELKKELNCLRIDLQQVRDDRDHALAQVQSLSLDIVKFKEISGKSSKDFDMITVKSIALEVCLPTIFFHILATCTKYNLSS